MGSNSEIADVPGTDAGPTLKRVGRWVILRKNEANRKIIGIACIILMLSIFALTICRRNPLITRPGLMVDKRGYELGRSITASLRTTLLWDSEIYETVIWERSLKFFDKVLVLPCQGPFFSEGPGGKLPSLPFRGRRPLTVLWCPNEQFSVS